MMLILPNVTIELSNERKKIRVQPDVAKVHSYVMLVLPNVIMESSNVKKKNNNKGTTECNKSTIAYDVCTAQCDNGIVKCDKKKKIKVPLNVRKVWSNVMLILPNVTMEPSNVIKKK